MNEPATYRDVCFWGAMACSAGSSSPVMSLVFLAVAAYACLYGAVSIRASVTKTGG